MKPIYLNYFQNTDTVPAITACTHTGDTTMIIMTTMLIVTGLIGSAIAVDDLS